MMSIFQWLAKGTAPQTVKTTLQYLIVHFQGILFAKGRNQGAACCPSWKHCPQLWHKPHTAQEQLVLTINPAMLTDGRGHSLGGNWQKKKKK